MKNSQMCTTPCQVCGTSVTVPPGQYFGVFCRKHHASTILTDKLSTMSEEEKKRFTDGMFTKGIK